MAFELRDLDDRPFDELFSRARRRIPAYLHEWTDHNESDPGIALLQLFAWLTENAIYRLDRVPDERMYRAFLNLLGLSPRPAVCAEAIVGYETALGQPPRELSAGELRLTGTGPEGDVSFEPEGPVPLVGARIGAVLVDNGISSTLVSRFDANEDPEVSYPPFGKTQGAGRYLYVGLDTSENEDEVEIVPQGSEARARFHVRSARNEEVSTVESSSIAPPARTTSSDVVWEARTSSGWQRLQSIDGTDGLRRDGMVTLTLPDSLSHGPLDGDPDQSSRYWIRAVPQRQPGPEERAIRALVLNAARVRQWQTFAEELLQPGSDSTAGQRRTVKNPPILLDGDPPVVRVTGADGETVFEYVEDLPTRDLRPAGPGSGPLEPEGEPRPVFTVDDSRRQIVFGDGLGSAIPEPGVNNLKVSYRSGGGETGNHLWLDLTGSNPFLRGVVQHEASTGGRNEQRVEDAVKEAAGRVRTLDRAAVTALDFEQLAVSKAGAARAIARNRVHPLYPAVETTGAVTLIVIPPRAGSDDRAPSPDPAFLRHVSQQLEELRVLTTELYVVPPRYQRVGLTAKLVADRGVDLGSVKEAASASLSAHLDPISGGRQEEGWPLGRAVGYGELISLLVQVPGVRAVTELRISIDGRPAPPCQDAPLEADALARLELPVIDVSEEGRATP